MEVFKTIKVTVNKREVIDSFVVEEFPLTVILEGKKFLTLLCTPSDLESLVRGFLFTCGIIKKVTDIKKIDIDLDARAAMVDLVFSPAKINIPGVIASSGGRENAVAVGANGCWPDNKDIKITSDFKIESQRIYSLMENFLKASQIYLKTGGVHSAALAGVIPAKASQGVIPAKAGIQKILIFKEDIGRHNAIDKVVGEALFKDISLQDKALITTGRVSSEIVTKIQKCRIPVIISKSAPTNQAVRFAEAAGITLIGFVRKSSMNIYTNQDRVQIE
jgi:FdhD protein